MSENNITITNNNIVNVPRQSRGAGTVLVFLFLWWLLPTWWSILFSIWIIWLIIVGIIAIWDTEFAADHWYQPWPAWLFGIR
jgi:hypothetical protein